ncbi:putative aminoadipate reductase [Mycena crocata]|nr:putative aminoadipate reductase [Mycena crocata]
MSSSPTPKTIPRSIAHNSASNPSGPFYIFSDPSSANIVTITHLEFGRAVDRAAHILRPHAKGSDGEVVAIITLSDTILYQTLLVSLIRANLIPFPISPRNSPAAIVHLLRATLCRRIISTCVTLEPLLVGIKQAFAQAEPDFSLRIDEVPSLSQVYPNLGVEAASCPFEPYMPSINVPALDDVCVYLHSSGSTGLPKAIPQTHRALIEQSSFPPITDTRDYDLSPIGVMALPSFHTLGLYLQVLQPLSGNPVALYPPTALSPAALPMMPSPNNILEHTRKTNCKTLLAIPALVSVWAASPDAVAYLATLSMVVWGGGTLPSQVGNFLQASGVKLRGVYGSTETGPICFIKELKGDEQEWEWYRIADQIKVRWVPQGDGTFECQLLTWEKHTLMVENLTDTRGYATSDLFINHPEKKYLWKMVGRIDDVIVHTSGEKTVPAPMEDILLASPFVAGAVIFGRERAQTGVLIEPAFDLEINIEDATRFAELRNTIWPVVQKANATAPAFSRIFKEMIAFTSIGKPLPRAAKGTVQRKPALDLYAGEIEAVYDAVAENAVDSIKPPTAWRADPIATWLSEVAKDLVKEGKIVPDIDLFHQGFDSLSATVFRIRIMGGLRSSKDGNVQKASQGITQNLVYSQPTISKLSTYLESIVHGNLREDSSYSIIHDMVEKYSSGLAKPVSSTRLTRDGLMVVLLTGSTGNLGSHILALLLKNPRVAKVYVLNRPSPASTGLIQRHKTTFEDRGLNSMLLASPKLAFVEGHVTEGNLGLASDVYDEIRTSVHLIIHNAWQLDFNLTLASFEPHVRGTRNLVDLALASSSSPKFIFTSSIAAMTADPAICSAPVEITYVAAGARGYGQSKFVAEEILKRSGLDAVSLRIGQLFGGLPKGAWSITDWIPILVKTSMTLGQLPSLPDGVSLLMTHSNKPVSWLDFETAAQAVVDVAFDPLDSEEPASVLTVVNPQPVSWNFVMDFLREAIANQCSVKLKVVPFSEWYASLESLATTHDYSTLGDTLPGIKLLEIFSRLSSASLKFADGRSESNAVGFSTEKIQALSKSMRSAASIGREHAEAWVNYWRSAGFL